MINLSKTGEGAYEVTDCQQQKELYFV